MRLFGLMLLALGLLGLLMMMAIPIWIGIIFVFWRLLMPWIIVGLAIWVVFRASGGSRQRRRSRHFLQPAPPSRVPDSSHSWQRPQPQPRTELPIDVQVKVEQIRRKVEVLLAYASRFPPFSQDLYIVRQTASEYLPRTIDAYRALPFGQGEHAVDASGKTALQELKEQLDLLDSKLDEIAEDLQRQDLNRLLANRRFLEERFGRTRV